MGAPVNYNLTKMASISFFNEEVEKPKIKTQTVKLWIKNVISSFGKKTGNINYIFCSDDYLLKINNEYLSHDYYTDIITFNYCENDLVSGDIFISLDRVEENSNEFNSGSQELYRVMIHGILHLIGFDDHTEKEKQIMREEENKALKILES